MQFHACYNVGNYPHFIARHANWGIYSDSAGRLAAIPVKPGCLATHYGDLNHARRIFETEAKRPRSIAARWKVIERRLAHS